MTQIAVALASFLMGWFIYGWTAPPPKVCPECKEVPRAVDIEYSKALVNCISQSKMTDFECIRFLNGGNAPRPSSTPSPKAYPIYTPKPHVYPSPTPEEFLIHYDEDDS